MKTSLLALLLIALPVRAENLDEKCKRGSSYEYGVGDRCVSYWLREIHEDLQALKPKPERKQTILVLCDRRNVPFYGTSDEALAEITRLNAEAKCDHAQN